MVLWGNEFSPQEKVGSKDMEMAMRIDGGKYGTMLIELPRVIITGASFDSSGRDNIIQSVDVETFNKNIEIPLKNPITLNTECLITTNLKKRRNIV